MQWKDIRKLLVGARVTFGNSKFTAKCTYTAEGYVKHVTSKGGVLVAVRAFGVDPDPLQEVGPRGEAVAYEQWVPYSHIIQHQFGHLTWTQIKRAYDALSPDHYLIQYAARVRRQNRRK